DVYNVNFSDAGYFNANNGGLDDTSPNYNGQSTAVEAGRYFSNFGWSNTVIEVCWNAGSGYSCWASECTFVMTMSDGAETFWFVVGVPVGDATGSDIEGDCAVYPLDGSAAAGQTDFTPFTYEVDASGDVLVAIYQAWDDGTGLQGGTVTTADTFFTLGGEVPGACADADGSCGEVHSTPGCTDVSCCALVCDAAAGGDPFCCEVSWDSTCVDNAIALCGIYIYTCDNPAYANDCATAPQLMTNGERAGYSTVDANYDGPIISCAADGAPNVWFLIEIGESVDQLLSATTCNDADYDTALVLWDGGLIGSVIDPSNLPNMEAACNDDGGGCPDYQSFLTASVTAGHQYLISATGWQGSVGTGGLTVSWETPDPPLPPYTCDIPGPDTFSQSNTDVLTSGGVACAGGTTTENAYCRIYSAADMGNDMFTIDCIRFGVTNPGSYIEGEVNVFKSANGTAVPYADMELLATAPYGFYTTDGLAYDVVTFDDGAVVDLSDGSALVIELSYGASPDGFVTFGGGTSADVTDGTTYLRSASCGLAEFVAVGDIGFDLEWAVFVDGTAGAGQPDCPGDFNGDGMVDGADFGYILAAWGICPGCPEDLNGDGEVNGADVGLVLSVWGACP
ncbi:MAG: hypothetical protein OSA40_11975, partial [Phycisphaerales bacterium]|nr:hypothetical protein [Phycisphaerales bacterium]